MATVVLLGLMGSGKSTVGRLLAERLGWRFVDLDEQIERGEGRSVAEIFTRLGEPGFRALETKYTRGLAGMAGLVLAPGGGWITVPGRLEAFGSDTLSVWLQVSPATALARLAAERHTRPLLSVDDPLAAAERLLAEREPLYRGAALHVATEGRTPLEIAVQIEDHLRSRSPSAQLPGGPP